MFHWQQYGVLFSRSSDMLLGFNNTFFQVRVSTEVTLAYLGVPLFLFLLIITGWANTQDGNRKREPGRYFDTVF